LALFGVRTGPQCQPLSVQPFKIMGSHFPNRVSS
jgi:hypothetical protein